MSSVVGIEFGDGCPEDGYAALTSRNISRRVGVHQQLVYYYFQTMDDLYVAAFRRAAERELQKLKKALHSDRPLHQIWEACIHTQDNRLVAEFTAFANRSEELRKEVIKFIKKIRRIQSKALTKSLRRGPLPSIELSASAIVMTMPQLKV